MNFRFGRSRAALLAAAAFFLFSPAQAQRNLAVGPAGAGGERVALVIGNSAYVSRALANPVNDANDMAQALRALGFRVTVRTNATHRQMVEAISQFGNDLKRGGVGLFYYAGHGVESKGRNYLIPIGSAVDSEAALQFEAVDANRVLAYMEEAGNPVNVMILDACRDNPFGRSWRSAAQGLAAINAPIGSFIAFATAPGSVAADGSGRNGIFTKYLLASLKQPDLNIDSVFTRVAAGVSQETGRKQVP